MAVIICNFTSAEITRRIVENGRIWGKIMARGKSGKDSHQGWKIFWMYLLGLNFRWFDLRMFSVRELEIEVEECLSWG